MCALSLATAMEQDTPYLSIPPVTGGCHVVEFDIGAMFDMVSSADLDNFSFHFDLVFASICTFIIKSHSYAL